MDTRNTRNVQGAGTTGQATRTTAVADEPANTEAERRQLETAIREAGGTRGQFLSNAAKFLDSIYKWGGGHAAHTGIQRVDCSGLVLQAARMTPGAPNLDGTADTQSRLGRPVAMDQLQPGDLLFRHDEQGVAKHVGIYIGNGQFMHAPSEGEPVRIDSVAEYGKFNAARRVFDDAPAANRGDAALLGGQGQTSRLRLP